MSYESEEPEDTSAEPNRNPIKIAVETEITFGEVLDRIAGNALAVFARSYSGERGESVLRRTIEGTIATAVRARATAAVERLVDASVEKILTEGWASWGVSPHEPTTLTGVIVRAITAKTRKSYNDPELTLIERRVDAFVEAETRRALEEELGKARQRFRDAVDRLIEAKVLEAARAALKGER